MSRNNPAFPVDTETGQSHKGEIYSDFAGLTKRELCALQFAAAMAGSLSPDDIRDIAGGIKGGRFITGAAVILADALLSALEGGEHDR